MKDWPYTTHPTGWYQVDWTAQLASGDVRPMTIFDEDVVLYRTEAGVANVVDAYCPHLGGNLGAGGCVVGESIQCPWHGWEWDLDGRNARSRSPTGCTAATRRSGSRNGTCARPTGS